MTALCGGGTSAPKFTTAAEVDYSSGLLAAIFAAYDIAWLIPIIPFVGLAPLVLSTFCGTDPPSMSTLTTAESQALLNLDITSADWATGLPKVQNIALNAIWNYACQCTSGTYTAPVAPNPPSGTAITQYPTVVGANCYHSSDAPTGLIQAGNVDCIATWRVDWYDNGSHIYQQSFSPVVHTGQATSITFPVPPGAIGFQVEYTSTNCGNFSGRAGQGFSAPGITQPQTLALQLACTYDSVNNEVHSTTVADLACGAGPQIPQSCCPPDPSVQASLDAILTLVTLIQRQIAPFAYVKGFPSGFLSGNGQIAVQGDLGALITVSSSAFGRGIEVGNPDVDFGSGWINWGNADGWTAREFISADQFLTFPPLAGQFTLLGYSLPPGMFIQVTELQREP